MKRLIVVALFLTAGSASAVTLVEIAQQIAVVRRETATLDSLKSLWRAERVELDSVLTAAKVKVLASENAEGGSEERDPLYIAVDVPYSTWSEAARLRWDLARERSGLRHTTTAVIGRYNVRQDAVYAFLRMTKSFVSALAQAEE